MVNTPPLSRMPFSKERAYNGGESAQVRFFAHYMRFFTRKEHACMLKEPVAIKKQKKATNHRTKKELAKSEDEALVLPANQIDDITNPEKMYAFFKNVLIENGLWWPSDDIHLQLYVNLIAERDKLTKKINKTTNNAIRNALVKERHVLISDALEYEKQLGLTVLARAQLLRKKDAKKKPTAKDKAIALM